MHPKLTKVKRGLVAIVQRSLGPILVASGASDHFQWGGGDGVQPRTVRVAGVNWPPQRGAAALESDTRVFRKLFYDYAVDLIVGGFQS